MKKCDKHHGDIEYDNKLYRECPLCYGQQQLKKAIDLLHTVVNNLEDKCYKANEYKLMDIEDLLENEIGK
jgi:hypothetical protein